MNVAVYGSSGYLGTLFRGQHLNLICLGRNDDPVPGFVHVDFSFPNEKYTKLEYRNYQQAILTRATLCRESKSKYIYIGSISSIEPIVSKYGLHKHLVEEIVKSADGSILRLGLVFNESQPGGRHAKLITLIRLIPVLPIPNRSTFQLFITNESDAVSSINTMITAEETLECIAKGTYEKNIGWLLEKFARNSNKRTIHLGIKLSRVLEALVRNSNFYFLDSLKSLTVKRSPNLKYISPSKRRDL